MFIWQSWSHHIHFSFLLWTNKHLLYRYDPQSFCSSYFKNIQRRRTWSNCTKCKTLNEWVIRFSFWMKVLPIDFYCKKETSYWAATSRWIFSMNKVYVEREPWPCDYERKFMSKRSWVRIPEYEIIWWKIALKIDKSENKQKRDRGWPIFNKVYALKNMTPSPPLRSLLFVKIDQQEDGATNLFVEF